MKALNQLAGGGGGFNQLEALKYYVSDISKCNIHNIVAQFFSL